MKRILSFILVVCLVLSLLAGISFSVFADGEYVAITGVTAPVAGQALVTDGISGAPEGFTLEATWSKYNYEYAYFEPLPAGAVAEDNAVYQLELLIQSQGTAFIPRDESMSIAGGTINGETNEAWLTTDYRADGYYGFAYAETYAMAGIQHIDDVTIEALPAKAAGTSADMSGVVIPANVGYYIGSDSFWRDEDYNFVTTPLEANKAYELSLILYPKEGYWFSAQTRVNAPEEPTYQDADYRGMYYIDFDYDLRPVVKNMELTLPADPQPGQTIPAAPVTIPADAKYAVQAQWLQADGTGGWVETTDAAFGFRDYALSIILTPAEGYTFLSDVDIYINGTDYDWVNNVWAEHWSETEIRLMASYYISPENGYVWNVYLEDLPEQIQPGETAAKPDVKVNYGDVTISNVQWVDKDHNPFTGKFEANKQYYLAVTLAPKAGYAFEEYCYVEAILGDNNYQYPDTQIKSFEEAVVYVSYSLFPKIEQADVLLTKPQVGAAPAKPTVPAGSKYTIEDYQWHYTESDEEVVKFEDNKRYYLEINLKAENGYQFDENATLTINGEELEYSHCGGDYAYLYVDFSFKNAIDRVDITLPEYKLGDKINMEGIKVPEGANYYVDTNVSWWNASDAEPGETFGKDRYFLYLLVKANDTYEFTRDTKFYINGKLWEDFYIYTSGYEVEVDYDFSFRDVINKVELPALPTVNLGDTATAPQLQVPEGSHYQIDAQWTVHTGGTTSDPFDGVFADKTAYYLSMILYAETGYEFAKDVQITVGGQTYTGIKVGDDKVQLLAKLYSFGLNVIDKIELTTTEPEIGKAPGKLTAAENAGYTVDEFSWGVGKNDEFFEAQSMKKNETFAEGKYYFLHGSVVAKEGYIFADNAKIYINGKEVEGTEFLGMPTVMGDAAIVIHNFGQLQKPVTPPSGDTTPVVLLISLLALASAGMITLIATKKRFAK